MPSTPERQLAIIIDLAAAAVELADESEWWAAVALAVAGPLFHADVMAVNIMNVADGFGWFSVVEPAEARTLLPVDSPMSDVLMTDHPFSQRLAHGPVTGPLNVSDLISQRMWRRRGSYRAMIELTGGAFHMTLHFRSPAPHQESLSVVRADRDYDAHEMQLAGQLQSVLQGGLSHLRSVARCELGCAPADIAAARNSARAMGITERERLVLELIDRGMPTTSVGRQLGISPRTVYKHQQNVYRKLGVHDRVSALLEARHHLLLPAALPPAK